MVLYKNINICFLFFPRELETSELRFAGLLASSGLPGLPVFVFIDSGKEDLGFRYRRLQQRDCSGFSPDSLLILSLKMRLLEQNICKYK